MKKKIIGILIILLILTVTFSGSVAFFSYLKKGKTSNSIKIGELTFKYTETSKIGNGINLNEAYPISDSEGKVLEEYFDFKVEGNLSRSDLEYEVEIDTTLADIPDSGIKVYLTEVVNGEEKEINSVVNLLSSYEASKDGRIIYRETILKNTKNYEKNFRLRLWVDEAIDWTDDEYLGHSGIYKVNVRANSNQSMANNDVVTDRTATIERVVANNKYLFAESNDENVDYEVTVPYTVNNVDIEVYESNTQATSETTPLSNLSGVSTKTISQNIHTGNNYFKTVTTSSNGKNQEEYILKVVKEADPRNDLLNLEVEGYSLTPTFDPNTTEYTLTLEEPSITISGNKVSDVATIEGLGEKTLSFGENTFNIEVTSEGGTTKTYIITVTNSRPVAPTITGGTGTGEWTSTAPTIELAGNNSAFAISGIAGYEYYKTQSTEAPTDATEGTILPSPYSLQITDEGTTYVYYRTVSNKGFKSVWSSPQVINLDTATPSVGTLVSVPSTANSITANFGVASSASGIKSTNCYYGTSNNPTTVGTVSGNNCVFNGLTANKTYYFKKCVTNNANTTACSTVSNKITAGQVYNYAYTGSVQSLKIPYTGTYKLEVWGAQGGGNNIYIGGKGGYSVGNINLNKNDNLYVVVGQHGDFTTTRYTTLPRTYNGGGSATGTFTADVNSIEYRGSGGGATHIATASGILSSLSNNKNSILIVAGGGGGAGYYYYAPTGGERGQNGYDAISVSSKTTNFGQGIDSLSGGGGGYSGGDDVDGGYYSNGGTGYIGGVTDGNAIAGNSIMPTYNGISTMVGNTGNGYARITITNIN